MSRSAGCVSLLNHIHTVTRSRCTVRVMCLVSVACSVERSLGWLVFDVRCAVHESAGTECSWFLMRGFQYKSVNKKPTCCR